MFRALKVINFRLYYCGQLCSLAGTWMQNVALSWLVYRLTHSTSMLGLVTFVSTAPVLLLGLPGGYIIDHFDRRKILLVTQSASLVQASLLAYLTFSGHIQIWQIMVLAALLGCIHAVDSPCRQAFIVDLVGEKDIVNAVGLASSLFHGSRVIGPAIAGLVIATASEGTCFAVNALSFLGLLIALLAMRDVHRHRADSSASNRPGFFDAFRFVQENALAKAALFSSACTCFLLMQYIVLLPVFAKDVFHGNAMTLGLLTSGTAVGALLSTLAIARWGSKSLLLPGVGIANLICGLALAIFSKCPTLGLALIPVFLIGIFNTFGADGSTALLQLTVPDKIRGRLMSLFTITIIGSMSIGSLILCSSVGSACNSVCLRFSLITKRIALFVSDKARLSQKRRTRNANGRLGKAQYLDWCETD
jgi:MFS family permease